MNKETSMKTLEEFYSQGRPNISGELNLWLQRATDDCQKSRTAYELIYHRAEKETLNKVLALICKGEHS